MGLYGQLSTLKIGHIAKVAKDTNTNKVAAESKMFAFSRPTTLPRHISSDLPDSKVYLVSTVGMGFYSNLTSTYALWTQASIYTYGSVNKS